MKKTERRPDTFPRAALVGAIGLVSFALTAALVGRIEGPVDVGASKVVTAQRDLRFEDRADGAVVVTNAADGHVVEIVTGQSGFMRGTLRGLARARKQVGVGEGAPFQLTSWADGRLTLDDTATDRHIDLNAFGPTNTAVFARLMATPLASAERSTP